MENYNQEGINYYNYNDNTQEYYNSHEHYENTSVPGLYLLGSIFLCISIMQALSSLIYCKKKYHEYSKYKELEEPFLHDSSSERCSICLENYQKNETILKLKCKHIFHKECIKEWFHKKKQEECPLCRNII